MHFETKRSENNTPRKNEQRQVLFYGTFDGLTVHAVVNATAETPKTQMTGVLCCFRAHSGLQLYNAVVNATADMQTKKWAAFRAVF